MNDKRLPIQLEMAQCGICGLVHQHGGIAMGTNFVSEETAKRKEDLIAQTPTHYAPCSECEELVNKGYLGMIEFDPQLTVDEIPYRTGRLMWMRAHVFKDLFDEESYAAAIKNKAVFLDPEVFSMIKELQESNDGESSAENEEDV